MIWKHYHLRRFVFNLFLLVFLLYSLTKIKTADTIPPWKCIYRKTFSFQARTHCYLYISPIPISVNTLNMQITRQHNNAFYEFLNFPFTQFCTCLSVPCLFIVFYVSVAFLYLTVHANYMELHM